MHLSLVTTKDIYICYLQTFYANQISQDLEFVELCFEKFVTFLSEKLKRQFIQVVFFINLLLFGSYAHLCF